MGISAEQKHAYLIMAHNNFDQLQMLVSLLDDARNDLYLHIDKKAADFSKDCIQAQYAKVFFVDPISVSWGGDSQIRCEMILLKHAAPGHYLYYHFLSGMDLPLKTQDEIHGFFRAHSGKNFMEVTPVAMLPEKILARTQYYYLFQNIVGRKDSRPMRFLRRLDRKSVNLQARLGMKRKNRIPLYKGANWVSITDELAQYIIESEKCIKKQFYHSFCADELFLQSIAMHSPYRDTIVKNYYRAIDWERGSPYTFRREDVPQLLSSPNLFARKFDKTVDAEAIHLILRHLAK